LKGSILLASEDKPKLLADPQARIERRAQLQESHIARLTKFVGALRREYGPRITSFLGGSNGAGVPFPMNTNVNTHQSASAEKGQGL
jgi:hypothetical protein